MPAAGRSYTRFGAFLDGGGVAAFDAGALRFSRLEAVALDPHARLLLESTQVRDKLGYYTLHLHVASRRCSAADTRAR